MTARAPAPPARPRSERARAHPDWPELAVRWSALAGEWASLWAQSLVRWQPPATALGGGARDAGALDDWPALVDAYEMQLRALWRRLAPGAGELPQLPPATRDDKRFAAAEWATYPYFDLARRTYLLAVHFTRQLAERAPLAPAEKRRLAFAVGQWLDAAAPSNYVALNPEVARLALETRGRSLRHGVRNYRADIERGRISMTDESAFAVGRNLGVTPGDVVLRNPLIELIQYRATTERVHARPLLIVPPCINKYYILDLQPENSFVRFAVAEGRTVFVISWRNIPPELGTLTWDDYLAQGVLAALDAATSISGSPTVDALGFCVGGTLLASALAVLAARGDRRVASATFLTTLLDFREPGDIGVFVHEQMLAAREARLLAGERIHGGELASAFASLRANELVWSYVVNNYLKGRTPPAFDLLYWNSDSANLPGPMYVYYLRRMYLENRLREPGALTMLDEPIDLGAVRLPTYVLGAREDHIVPWRSAYASAVLLGGPTIFVLAASGHIAGTINPVSKNRRNYWTGSAPALEVDPDRWLADARPVPGSWWRHWADWLTGLGDSTRPAPARSGNERYPALAPAPGVYVLEQSRPAERAGPMARNRIGASHGYAHG